jgi:hypothetical protein
VNDFALPPTGWILMPGNPTYAIAVQAIGDALEMPEEGMARGSQELTTSCAGCERTEELSN